MKLLRFASVLLFAGVMVADTPEEVRQAEFYISHYEVSPSSSAAVLTIQATNTNRNIYLQSILIYCSVACVVTEEKDGTAATATVQTAVPLNSVSAVATARVYGASDVGVGTVLTRVPVGAVSPVTIDLTKLVLKRGVSGAKNYTFRTGTMTGDVRFSIIWGEAAN